MGQSLLDGFDKSHYKQASEALGGGSYGDVYRMDREPSAPPSLPASMALKMIKIRSYDGSQRREYNILMQCDHPNVLKIFSWEETVSDVGPKFLSIYTELCDINLKNFLYGRPPSVAITKHISKQMLEGCAYLHDKGIVHRDIKPANILINYDPDKPEGAIVKLADFGLARFMPRDAINTSYQYTACGTRAYASPELIRAMDKNDLCLPKRKFATDIFSMGVVIFEMLTTKLPFGQTTKGLDVINELSQPTFNVRARIEEYILPDDLSECLTRMLQWDPKERPNAAEVIEYFEVKVTDSTNHLDSSWQVPVAAARQRESSLTVDESHLVSPECFSEVIRNIAAGDLNPIVGHGYARCIGMILEKKMKEGHIICIAQTFHQHMIQEKRGKWIPHILPPDIYSKLHLEGENKFRIVSMHFGVYVGRSEDGSKCYVAEFPGGDPNCVLGKVKVTEMEKFFDDDLSANSAFLFLQPFYSRRKTQQHALASIYMGLECEYHWRWFNSEAFAGICAGYYDGEVSARNLFKPAHAVRVLLQGDRDVATLKQEQDTLFEPYKKKMLEIFSDKKEAIDSHRFKLHGSTVILTNS